MAGYQGCISLALVCLWLCHHSLAVNSKPCQPNTKNKAYNDFLRKHVPERTPEVLNTIEWLAFITKEDLLRPKQSFLSPKDKQRVKDVCSDKGGLWYEGNKCISRDTFNFTVVKYDRTYVTCVERHTKHLILACDKQCLPIHFKANYNKTPGKNAKGCESRRR